MPASARHTERLLDAVHKRDADGVASCFTPGGRWVNVPHPPAVGRREIAELLRPVLERSDRVQWELLTSSYTEHRAWLERLDRFWIGGVEYSVACNGVLEVDPSSDLIVELRDYVDLGEWRQRLAPALQ